MCRSPFQHPLDRPDVRRNDWANFQTYLEAEIPFNSELHNGMAIDTRVENSGAVLKDLAASTPERRPRNDAQAPMPTGIQDEIARKIGCGGSGRSPANPL
jgi:hypothetical protein